MRGGILDQTIDQRERLHPRYLLGLLAIIIPVDVQLWPISRQQPIAGHAGLKWDGTRSTATFTDLYVDLDNAVTGTLGGPVDLLVTSLVLEPTGTLTVGPSTVEMDLHIAFDDTSVTIDGDATVLDDDSPITFDGVVVLRSDISPPCPTPNR